MTIDYSHPQPLSHLITSVMDGLKSTERNDPRPRHASLGYFALNITKKRLSTNTLTLISGSNPTVFLLNLLSNISIFWERPALVVLQENDPETICLRLLSIISGVNTSDILSGQISPSCFASIDDGAIDLYHAPAYFWSPHDLDMAVLEREALSLLERHGKMSLFIDTVEKLTPSSSQFQYGSALQQVCNQLTEFAESHNIPVVGGAERFEVGDLSRLADLVVDIENNGSEATIRISGLINEEKESTARYFECCGRYAEKYYKPWGNRFEG
jgi:replicative DNA helicase